MMENLAKALAAFQAEMPTVAKDKKAVVKHKEGGGQHSYTYTDLASLTREVIPILNKHGLAFITAPRMTPNGYELVGYLIHTSGEQVEGSLPIFGRQQEMGSALSYSRRYLLGCMTGVVTEDDDDGARAARAEATPNKDWEPIADTAEMMTHVADVKQLWTAEGVAKAPKVIQDRIKAHVAALKAEAGEETP